MRRAAKIDANQTELVRELRDNNISVAITSAVGSGFPDLVVGYKGKNYLFEIKDPNKPPSARKLTKDQQDFHCAWCGQVEVIQTAIQAMEIMKCL